MNTKHLWSIFAVTALWATLPSCAYDVPESGDTGALEEATTETSEALTHACKPGSNCGMTWVKQGHNSATGQDTVSCHDYPQGPHYSCDAYVGDTECSSLRPILCIRKDGSGSNGFVGSFYNGWAAGNIGTTHPIQGSLITSQSTAGDPTSGDAYCVSELGKGWQMAEFHDGNGGWAWTAYGNLNDRFLTGDASHAPYMRFWVAVNDQVNANCW